MTLATSTPSLQQRLNQPYQREDWRTIVHSIFPDGAVGFFDTPQTLAAVQESVKSTLQLGTIDLPDGNIIALLEVETSDQVKLARNRVALRNFVASFIDEAGAAGVLAVFHQAASPDWRLTYASRQTTLDEDTFQITTVETAPRRFTFLLGPNEACRTAAARLAVIQEKGQALALPDVEKAFSVETLTKDFFKKYKEHYQGFTGYLLSPANSTHTRASFGVPIFDDAAEQEKADKPVRDFVKTLLGRLVFLHFLQKKGWLGCSPNGRKWKGGDLDFLQSYLLQAKSKGESDLFHSKYLCPLFFEALNTPDRPGDIFKLTGTRLPYLNGGLFEEDGDEQRGIDFPQELFSRLLDFFGEYNFTIDENDPEDHEVGIDPEMLGHIFENLLEDNKDKGAFYTPKAIVAYMARQSLLHYLQTHLGENKELERLLNEKDLSNHPTGSFVAENKTRIADLLDAVKICDPAIGSGAFPIGLLQEILWTRLALQPELNVPAQRAELKRQIIQNSIHGVDIDPGAIEIARLRFWLALVVDEDEPRPLPNLDYKIHRADSLIEYIRGEPVNLGTEPPKNAKGRKAVEKLIAAKRGLFTAQTLQKKRDAWFDLYLALAELARAEFEWLLAEADFADGDRMSYLNQTIKDFSGWILKIDVRRKEKVHHQENLLDELRQWFDDLEKPTFLWNLHFGEIFANGGFDVVIANPPYFDIKGMPSDLARRIFQIYPSAKNRINLYSTFIDLSFNRLISKKGAISFVVPNSLLNNSSYALLRKMLLPRVRQVIKLPDRVFEEPVVETILLFSAAHEQDTVEALSFGNAQKFLVPKKLPVISKSLWKQQEGTPFQLGISKDLVGLLRKIQGDFPTLESESDISLGITPYDKQKGHTPQEIKGRVFHSEVKILPEHVPLIDGASIRRFFLDSRPKGYIRYGPWLGAPRKLVFFTAPRVVIRQILATERPRIICAYTEEAVYHTQIAFSVVPTRCEGEGIRQKGLFLSAILCSSVIDFYHEVRCLDPEKIVFPKALIANFRRLPIPHSPPADKARLAELAEACGEAAKKDDQASLAVLEAEINQIVYRLFDLTAEEIDLIESSLARVIP